MEIISVGLNQTIDENGIQEFNTFQFHDKYNNYTFSVTRTKGTTIISPAYIPEHLIELKVGVLLPFHQNNNGWTRIMTISGISAIRLAVAEINAQNLIPGAYITLVEKDSYPKTVEGQEAITEAVFSAISLIQEGVIGVIGDISSSWTSLSALMTSTLEIPQCSFSAVATSLSDKSQFGYFFRTAPTNLLYSDAVLSFVIDQEWSIIGILYSNNDYGQQLSENIVMKARLNGIRVRSYQPFYEKGAKSDIKKAIDSLISTGVRIIYLAAEGSAQLAALTVAAHNGYMNDDNVWITTDTDATVINSAINVFNSILKKRVDHTDIIPAIYNEIDDSFTDNTKSSKKQNDLNLIDPVEYYARSTLDLHPIDYNQSFAGGIFIIDFLKELPGYPPFDQFLDKWSHLDPIM
ncbi:periplasmic binding protein-like I [Pilobolus umbonatus]|nr:periplasmic binding protein-like I [Pilobolus umbonatus]